MPVHTTLFGHRIEYETPSPELERLLHALERMANDATKTEADMIALAYSRANPLLDPALFPERGGVTKATLEHPAYAVVTDLLARKRVAVEGIDVAELAAHYCIGVAEAAARLGVHESAVRQAIKARRLPSWIKEGCHFLEPRSLETFLVERRGPAPETARATPLEACLGHTPDASFRIRYPGALQGEQRVEGNIVKGRIEGWLRVGVLFGGEGKHRFVVLAPSREDGELAFGPFFIKGKFVTLHKENNSRRARAAWDAFKAE